MIRRILKSLVIFTFVMWAGGTTYFEWKGEADKPTTCVYRVYVTTWPLWNMVPHSTEVWLVEQSFKACGYQIPSG